MYPEFKKFVNLIGHDITISGHATLPGCENPCRVETNRIAMDFVPFDREDVFCVDTGPTAIRDQSNQVVAVTQLSL